MKPHYNNKKYFLLSAFFCCIFLFSLSLQAESEIKDESKITVVRPISDEINDTLQVNKTATEDTSQIVNLQFNDNNIDQVLDKISSIAIELKSLSSVIDNSGTGFISLIFGWLLQIAGIIAVAWVAFKVMNSQAKESWTQFYADQEESLRTAEDNNIASWQQLLISLGTTRKIEHEKLRHDAMLKLQKNVKLQETLSVALQMHLKMISDYVDLSISRIESLPSTLPEARKALDTLKLPIPPGALLENLHMYTASQSNLSEVTMLSYHFYNFSTHLCEMQKRGYY